MGDFFDDDFNAESVEIEDRNFDLIPKGTKCWFELIEAAIKPTKDGRGRMLEYKAEIKDGPFTNRKILGHINLRNPSQECQRIGEQQRAALYLAMGIAVARHTDELLFKPFQGTIGVELNKNNAIDPKTGEPYPPKNIISYYKPMNEAAEKAAKPAPKPAQAAQNQAAAKSRRPWETAAA